MNKDGQDKLKDNIRALVPKYLIEIINRDVKHFSISRYKLCNDILVKFSLKFRSNYCQDMMSFEQGEYLQFNLYKQNIVYYNSLRKGIDGITESEMIREIFSSYGILPPFLREINLFREKIAFLISAQKEYRVLKIHTRTGIAEGRIKSIYRNEDTDYLMILLDEKSYYISQIEIIGWYRRRIWKKK